MPPPPDAVAPALGALDRWLHGDDAHPPLVRVGFAHVQFETIHHFLDGNGRMGRLLCALLVEHWRLLSAPLLALSLACKRHRAEYDRRLSAVRSDGDWEGWTTCFLDCVRESADDGVDAARRICALIERDRRRVDAHAQATVPAIRLFDLLPEHHLVSLPLAVELLATTKPTASKAIQALVAAGVLSETTGKLRDRVWGYRGYLEVLGEGTEVG